MSDAVLWQKLEDEIARQVDLFPGVAGVCVTDLTRGGGFAVHGDEAFPAASTIKIHILTQLLLRAERGEIDLDEAMCLTPDLSVPGSGVLTYLEGEVELVERGHLDDHRLRQHGHEPVHGPGWH